MLSRKSAILSKFDSIISIIFSLILVYFISLLNISPTPKAIINSLILASSVSFLFSWIIKEKGLIALGVLLILISLIILFICII